MRDNDADTIAALAAAPQRGIFARQLVWITAKKLSDGSTASFGFWNERLPATLDVVVGTGTESRTYQGDGALLSVDPIPLTSDISIRRTTFKLSLLHPSVRALWGEYRLKLAAVEIHRMALDPVTRLPVAAPRRRFLGSVDTAPVVLAQPGQEGGITVNCVSASAELTLINPAKRSDETQRRRSGDRHSRYADVVGGWTVPWGQSS